MLCVWSPGICLAHRLAFFSPISDHVRHHVHRENIRENGDRTVFETVLNLVCRDFDVRRQWEGPSVRPHFLG